ncbi:MAG: hypothetical protein AAF845_19230 [Bacteroidota bacterium]
MLAVLASLLVGLAPLAPASGLPTSGLPASVHEAVETSAVRDSITYYYARRDAAAIERLYRTARTREERLLCLYRLFPMTLDERYLDGIPSEAGVTSARELALISALWAFKTANSPAWRVPTYGRRSERILGDALARDPNDAYALLVRGQALLYKPRIFGGDVPEAQRTFERLRQVLAQRSTPGIHPFEAEVWIWMAVRKQDNGQGAALQRRLLAQNPLPMFRQFLIDPP